MMNEMYIQSERLDYLLEQMKEDSEQYRDLKVEDNYEEKRMALRSLMNIRAPRRLGEEILKVQDDFLQQEAKERGVVALAELPTIKEAYGMKHPFADKISVWQGDITRLSVDAIVNAANSQMLGCFVPCHKCIDNTIHSAAGMQLRDECNHIMNQKRLRYGDNFEEPTGQAIITKGYNLPSSFVIHTVGPIVMHSLNDSLRQDLRNCYQNVLSCAVEYGIRSVAFCCISTGEFHFPNDEAAAIAVETVFDYLEDHINLFDRIIFNVFKDLDKEYYEGVFKRL